MNNRWVSWSSRSTWPIAVRAFIEAYCQIGHFRVPKTLFQNEAKSNTFLVKISFICVRIKNHFHINGLAPNLALKQRLGATRKWFSCEPRTTCSVQPRSQSSTAISDVKSPVACRACRENSPGTPRAIALGSKPPLVTRIERTGLGTTLCSVITELCYS